MNRQRIRIIGLGNPLMADDGLGIKAIQLLEKQQLPEHIQLIDGGCGGLKLLPLLSECAELLLIDAADFSGTPGEIKVVPLAELPYLAQKDPNPDSHHFALPELLKTAEKLVPLPPTTLYLMQIKNCQPELRLSHEIELALPQLVAAVLDQLTT
jgi:hydrogenase maturation protease